MKCPFCTHAQTHVIDTRESDNGDTVRRRRECDKCGERYTTFERAELRMPKIIKSDQRRELFDEDKLRQGFNRSLEKRPVDADKIELAISTIIHHLSSSGEREVSTTYIGELVMQELSHLDEVAYVRFASVYRSFQTVEAFKEEIAALVDRMSTEKGIAARALSEKAFDSNSSPDSSKVKKSK